MSQPKKQRQNPPLRVLVTGGAGQISYALLSYLANGSTFGDRPVILQLLELDIPAVQSNLEGIAMELQDCAFPLLTETICTSQAEVAFKDADVAIFLGAFPRRAGMERKDLLDKNAKIFQQQGMMLEKFASRDVKVLVVGNPANTNCLALMTYAPSIPRENFTALTRLDHNRARALLARRIGVSAVQVQNVMIFGNHSSTQVPVTEHVMVHDYPKDGDRSAVHSVITDKDWLQGEFVKTVQTRGSAIIKMRGASSALSAARAISDHLRSWIQGTADGEVVSMAVLSNGEYGVPSGLIFSYPCTCANGKWSIVETFSLNDWGKQRVKETTDELLSEKETAFTMLGLQKSNL